MAPKKTDFNKVKTKRFFIVPNDKQCISTELNIRMHVVNVKIQYLKMHIFSGCFDSGNQGI